MQRRVFTVSAKGSAVYTDPYVPDTNIHPFQISLGVEVIGSAVYTVQHTFGDPFAVDFADVSAATAPTWYNHEFLTSVAVSDDGNYAFPVTGIRLKLNQAIAGAGGAKLTIIQSAP